MAATPDVAFSSGSACSSVEAKPSHVLTALGLNESMARRSVRFGVVHVGMPEIVDEVSAALRAEYGEHVEILSAPATPVIATHLGIGAWGIAYMVED